jgi:NADPH-dependent 2,4-dienoyl-CoA reductase/sulfur reductase-like enzyme
MLSTYTYPRYAYRKPPELGAPQVRRVPLVVVGAGPVGLAAAIDAAQLGLPVVLLDEDQTVSVGSRGLCYAKRALEVLDRLGVGDPVVAKGVTWNVGRTFHRNTEVFSFNLLPESGHRRPGMVNLQQYWLEQYLVERAQKLPIIDLRWQHKVVGVSQDGDGARVDVETADGPYQLQADWLIVAADGPQPDPPPDGPGHRGQGLPGPLPDRRRGAEGRAVPRRQDRALVLVRPAVPPGRASCCTARPTTSGASTSSSAGTPTPKPRSSPSA